MSGKQSLSKIMTVEDSEHIRKFVSIILESHNFDVIEAGTGVKALELFDKQHPHLVILDLGLPDMDGLDVLKKLREKSPDVPIIILSIRNDDTTKEMALELGATNYMTKPFNAPELIDVIKTYL